jgi:hypothetical protein
MKRRFASILSVGVVLLLEPLAFGQAARSFQATAVKQSPFRKSVEQISVAQLKDYLSFVAADEMEGRGTPSRGLDTTARFIATLLGRWGVKPGGDGGTYFQRIDLKREKLAPGGAEVSLGTQTFAAGKDFFTSAVAANVSGGLVYGGDGWYIKTKNADAYEGLDPKGKIVVVTSSGGLPRGLSYNEMSSLGRRGEDWIDPVAYAQKKGAVAVVLLTPLIQQANPEALEALRNRVEGGSLSPEKLARPSATLPVVYANLRLAQAIFAREKVDATTILQAAPGGTAPKSFELSPDKQLEVSIKTVSERVSSQNVVGIVEGADPSVKGEYIAFGAHYDHSGTRPQAQGDTILNGADDDGSGTVALMAMAEALAKAAQRPRRSAIFVWHMGEEMGLWGSEYFTRFPTVPIEKIVAQLNIDMIGRSRAAGDSNPRNKDLSGPDEVYVIGSKMMSTELGALSEAVNDAFLKLSFNYKYDDPKDPERFFYRSDHIHYARKGIPIIFYFTGVHADYHQPSDEVSKIDFAKFEKITKSIYATFWEIADLKSRPRVDKELPAEAR